MRKFLLMACFMLAICVPSIAQPVPIDENVQVIDDARKALLVLLGLGAIAGLVFYVVKRKKNEVDDEKMKEFKDNVDSLLNSTRWYEEIHNHLEKAKMFAIEEVHKIDILTQPVISTIPHESELEDPANNGKVLEWIIKHNAIRERLLNLTSTLLEKLRVYEKAANYINSIDDSKVYVDAYKEEVLLNFKPFIVSKPDQAVYYRAMENYDMRIRNHLTIRETLDQLLRNGKIHEVEQQLDLLGFNIEAIAKHQENIQRIKTEEERRKMLAEKGKKILRERAEALLSYCNEQSCHPKLREDARDGIATVMERLVEFKHADKENLPANYFLYVQLNHILDNCQVPYYHTQKRERDEAEAKAKEKEQPKETTRTCPVDPNADSMSVAFSAMIMGSSDPTPDVFGTSDSTPTETSTPDTGSADFGGGEFGGGGASGEY